MDLDPMLAGAGTTLVGLMVTEAWGQARDGVVALWRRVRPADADAVGRDLDEARAELVEARGEGEAGQETERELAGEWQRRLLRVLRDDPTAADELQRLLDAARGTLPETTATGVQMRAHATGRARIYQAGRDMRVEG